MGYPCFEVEVSRHGDPSCRRPRDVTFGIRASLFAPSTPSPEELLYAAAESGDAGSVAELLAAGTDPTHPNASDLTPLMHAVVGGHAAAIRLLLDVGAPCIALSASDLSINSPTSLKTEADRERDLELELYRSGSAPPTVEGSMGALRRAATATTTTTTNPQIRIPMAPPFLSAASLSSTPQRTGHDHDDASVPWQQQHHQESEGTNDQEPSRAGSATLRSIVEYFNYDSSDGVGGVGVQVDGAADEDGVVHGEAAQDWDEGSCSQSSYLLGSRPVSAPWIHGEEESTEDRWVAVPVGAGEEGADRDDADDAIARKGMNNYIPEMEHNTISETITKSVITHEAVMPDDEQCYSHPETNCAQDTVHKL